MSEDSSVTLKRSIVPENAVTPADAGAGFRPGIRKQPAVYILASKRNGTLYIGVTSNLGARTWRHKSGDAKSFSEQHRVHTLVYFELYELITDAIKREKRMKKWRRKWKLDLIETYNPKWKDLYLDVI